MTRKTKLYRQYIIFRGRSHVNLQACESVRAKVAFEPRTRFTCWISPAKTENFHNACLPVRISVGQFQSIIISSELMSIVVRPIEANITHDTEVLESMDPYVKIYFGGQQYRTAVCKDGDRNPSWNDVFTFHPAGDSNMRIEVWDSDMVNDDLIGEGSFNLMRVYNTPSMRSDHEYIDLSYNGKSAGRILISFQLQGMQGYWGECQFGGQGINAGQQGFNTGQQGFSQPGWNNQMNAGFGQPPMNNNPRNMGGW